MDHRSRSGGRRPATWWGSASDHVAESASDQMVGVRVRPRGRGSASILGTPAAVHIRQVLAHPRGEVLGRHPAGQLDCLPDLGQVLGAVRAASQVLLESPPLPPGQRPFQVRSHQLNHFLADKITTEREPHRNPPPSSVSSSCRSLPRPRCSSTRWLASLIASTAQTSSLLSPSTSRNSTTSR